MDYARWERIEAICEAALETGAAALPAYLAHACGDDEELRREVDSLLAQLTESPSFLERPIVDIAALLPNEPPADAPLPATIGPYRIERLIGRGGMGEVFLAVREAEDIRQFVALKVIRRGMGTDHVLQRFRLERRILANLHHPHIARLLDAAATDDGRPYFVMEYIAGAPITEYCDQRRLTVAQRLQLFQTVCKAVQHAHQNLVVHRDLKPRNILVGDDGAPMLLDFGIGKVLAPNETLGPALETSGDLRLLTPEYAAPEQVTGEPVTTSTDVYSLGILLCELLAGRHPYLLGSESRHEVERAVVEATPTRPSMVLSRAQLEREPTGVSIQRISDLRNTQPASLRRRLAGDLDNIVLMALRKEPDRRYPSAVALADDIRRHLDGLPVRAQPDTFGYRARKFVRRNAGAVAAGVSAFLALGATTGVTLVQSRRVARESQRVEHERDKAVEVRGFLLEMFGATGADRAVGDTVTARRLLDLQVVQAKTAYANRPELKAEMLEVLADGYDRLGLYADAEPLARDALTERRRILGDKHPDVSSALNMVGWIMHERGKSKDAELVVLEAVELRRAGGERYRTDLARSLNDLGVVYNALTRYAAAETVLTEALTIRRALLGDQHRAVGITASNLAAAYYFQGKVDSAIRVQGLAVKSLEQSVGRDHQRSIVALGNLAAFKRAAGDKGAEADYRDLLARQTRLQGSQHPQTAFIQASLASTLSSRGRESGSEPVLAEAESLYRRSLATTEVAMGPSHPQAGVILDRLGAVLLARNKEREALTNQVRAVSILRAAYGDSNQTTIAAVAGLAMVHWRLGNVPAAQRLQREVAARYTQVLGDKHGQTTFARARLCEFLLARGDALSEAQRNCALAEQTQRNGPPNNRPAAWLTGLRLAQTHLALGTPTVADSILAQLRPAIDTLPRESPARRLLDSLTNAASATRRR
jgi:serine/threonine protein kinase/tetratricopeptide (TPR) repeat protein